MQKCAYKLTDQQMQTYNKFQWELNKWYKVSGEKKLCSDGWLHFYSHPLLAVFLNPIHAAINNPRIFKVEVKGKYEDDNGLKCGYSEARLIKELALPVITLNQHIAFEILCAMEVYKEKSFVEWANDWLSARDRSVAATQAAWTAYAAATTQAAWTGATWTGATKEKNKKVNLIKIAKKALKYV